jgi:hypothetical protein
MRASALTCEVGGADLPVCAYLALEQRHSELGARVQRSVQIGRQAQQYETSDAIARRYIEVDQQPLAAQCSHRRGQWMSGFAHFESARSEANS